MSATITMAMLQKAVAKMKEHQIPPRTIKTRKEARELTANDPTNRVWHLGDKYYLVDGKSGRFAVAPAKPA